MSDVRKKIIAATTEFHLRNRTCLRPDCVMLTEAEFYEANQDVACFVGIHKGERLGFIMNLKMMLAPNGIKTPRVFIGNLR